MFKDVSIPVTALQKGDNIVSTWEVKRGKIKTRTEKLKTIDPCDSMPKTHVHVNRSMCYDLRGYANVRRQDTTVKQQEANSD